MMARLIFAVVSTLLEEVALVVIVLWGLPKMGIHIPLPGLIAVMALWLVWSIFTYQLASRTLMRKHLIGLPSMIGSKGKVVSPLSPDGLVRIKGELWIAKSVGGELKAGDEVIVVGQDSLKLLVRSTSESEGAA